MKKSAFAYDIHYDLSHDDIIDAYDDLSEDSSDKEIDEGRQALLRSLPETMTVVLPRDLADADGEDIGEFLAEYITEHTGYLLNEFMFDIK